MLSHARMLKYFIFFYVTCLVQAKFRFDNYTLYRILPSSSNHFDILRNLQDSDLRYDFWTEPRPGVEFVNILSSPENKEELEKLLKGEEIKFEIPMPNIQEAIDKETIKTYTRGNLRSMTWDAYYTNDQINAWMDDLVEEYPSIVTSIVGGVSYEGRPIKGLRISHGPGRRVIFLEAGIHSREWISPATTCFILNKLLTSEDPEVQKYAREYDWYIFPVTNPDGYIWSHDEFRMWRKNRRPIGDAFGVDLNRNWNSNWMEHGASTNPASEVYAGPGPFSEPETRHLSSFIRSLADRMDIYLSIHSFSQLLLIPFGNTTEPLANYHEAMNVGRRAMGALSVRYGTQYVTGNIAEAIYMATGGSDEWVKEHLHVPLVYCYELRDRGQFGFLLPAEQIQPSGEETLDSIIEMIHQARRFGVISGANAVTTSVLLIVSVIGAIFL